MSTAVYTNTVSQSLQALKCRLRQSIQVNLSVKLSTFQNFIGSMPNNLKAVIVNNKRHNSTLSVMCGHGQRPRLTLTFIGLLFCNFNGDVIQMSIINAV